MISGRGPNPGSVAAALCWSEVTLLAPIIRTSSAYLRALLCNTNGTVPHCGRRMCNVVTCWKRKRGGGVNITRNLAMCMLPAAKLRSTMGETWRLDGDQVFLNFCEGRAVDGRCQNWKFAETGLEDGKWVRFKSNHTIWYQRY